MAFGALPEAFEMPGKAIWRLQNATNHWGGRWGSLQRSPRLPSWWGGGWLLWASPLPAPNFQTPSEVKSYIRPWPVLATIVAYQIVVGGETALLTVVCPGSRFLVASPPHVHNTPSYCLLSTWSYNDNRKNQFFATDNRFQKQTILTSL